MLSVKFELIRPNTLPNTYNIVGIDLAISRVSVFEAEHRRNNGAGNMTEKQKDKVIRINELLLEIRALQRMQRALSSQEKDDVCKAELKLIDNLIRQKYEECDLELPQITEELPELEVYMFKRAGVETCMLVDGRRFNSVH